MGSNLLYFQILGKTYQKLPIHSEILLVQNGRDEDKFNKFRATIFRVIQIINIINMVNYFLQYVWTFRTISQNYH